MKIKTHKIYGVPKAICTAEQMIAYNLTFAYHDLFKAEFLSLPTEAAKSQAIADMRNKWLKWYRNAYTYKPGKYNEDAIFIALNNGIRRYMEKPFIACDYDIVGEVFTIPYELA